jgi:hypothetical protein
MLYVQMSVCARTRLKTASSMRRLAFKSLRDVGAPCAHNSCAFASLLGLSGDVSVHGAGLWQDDAGRHDGNRFFV